MDQGPVPVRRWRELLRSVAPPPGGRLAAGVRYLRARSWLFVVLLVASAIYLFYVSAGGRSHWPVYGNYYDLQAEAFRAGHTYLPLEPAPELQRAADPYDRVNIRYWALDLSYFRGKYYSYWGPLPALLQAAVKTIFGIHGGIGDSYIGLASACLATVGGALIIANMGRRLFGSVSKPVLVLCMLAFACANPMLHMVATTGTYQSAILAAQGFLIPGLSFAFDAVWHGGTTRARRLRLLLAGVCWAFAVGSRVTTLPPVAFLIGATALAEAWPSPRRWRSTVSNALWLGLPVAAAGIGLLAYNKARFDNPLEFGLSLQLSGYPRIRFDSKYWLPNLYSYSLRPFVASCQFPFVFQTWWATAAAAFPAGVSVPADYITDEPVLGWLRVVPITWFIPFGFLLVPQPLGLHSRRARAFLWCLVSFSAVASLTGMTAIGVYGATMRYLTDVTPGLVLLGVLGALALKTQLAEFLPKLTSVAIGALAAATIVMGLLVGYQGYNGQFHQFNPELDAKLVKALSFCGDSEPNVPRFMP